MMTKLFCMVVIVVIISTSWVNGTKFDRKTLDHYKKRVESMFYHAYDNYIHNAYPYDELKPISCKGFDTWGSYSLTLIDSLDMLIILGNRTEFERVVDLLVTNLNFDKDINVSVFETNIRIIGGLLSAHLLSYRLYLQDGTNELDVTQLSAFDPEWPCNGPLLKLAIKAANKLLPAFETQTGMPYGTVNLKNGVPKGETTETCVAGVGTFIIEFATLSRLTGDERYEKAAQRALDSLWNVRSPIDLIGNHLHVDTGKWTGQDATIGSGVDSYFEYLVKAGILLNKPELISQFRTYQRAIDEHLFHDGWFFWSNMNKGQKTLPLFSSLEAFYPGLLVLVGELDQAIKLINSYNLIWRQFGSLPEFYNIQTNKIHSNRDAYPLRPELIESLMYVLRATNNDVAFVEMAVDYLESIEKISRVECGFATVKDVKDHRLEDRMESFFLAETLKYFYLIFDADNFLHNRISDSGHKLIRNKHGECVIETGMFFFNTEAHPIDGASLQCCHAIRQAQADPNLDQDIELFNFLNLPGLLDKYVSLTMPNVTTNETSHSLESLKRDYELERFKLEMELQQSRLKMQRHCENNVTEEPYDSKSVPKTHLFSCSLKNSFKIFTSLSNMESYFP